MLTSYSGLTKSRAVHLHPILRLTSSHVVHLTIIVTKSLKSSHVPYLQWVNQQSCRMLTSCPEVNKQSCRTPCHHTVIKSLNSFQVLDLQWINQQLCSMLTAYLDVNQWPCRMLTSYLEVNQRPCHKPCHHTVIKFLKSLQVPDQQCVIAVVPYAHIQSRG